MSFETPVHSLSALNRRCLHQYRAMLPGPCDAPAMSGWKRFCMVWFHSSSDGVGSRMASTVSSATSTDPPLPPTGAWPTSDDSPPVLVAETSDWRDQSPGTGIPAAFRPRYPPEPRRDPVSPAFVPASDDEDRSCRPASDLLTWVMMTPREMTNTKAMNMATHLTGRGSGRGSLLFDITHLPSIPATPDRPCRIRP